MATLKQKPLYVFAANKHNEQNKPWPKKKKTLSKQMLATDF